MPFAGQVIRAADFTPLATVLLEDEFNNFTTTAFAPTSPACEITFLAPTSGNVRIEIGVETDSDTTPATPNDAEAFVADVEVRETDGSGAVIHTPTSDGRGIGHVWIDQFNSFMPISGFRVLTGLTPGQVYWAQLQWDVSLGNTNLIDLRNQNLSVYAIP